MGRRAWPRENRDSGFTLVEMLTVLAVLGIFAGVALTSFVSYQVQSQHRSAAEEVRSTLRAAGERALSEQRAYCVQLGASTWNVYRGTCGPSGTLVQEGNPGGSGSTFAASFTAPSGHVSTCPSGDDCAYFYPRGNSSEGTVVVSRAGRSDITIDVEGLTARVSSTG